MKYLLGLGESAGLLWLLHVNDLVLVMEVLGLRCRPWESSGFGSLKGERFWESEAVVDNLTVDEMAPLRAAEVELKAAINGC